MGSDEIGPAGEGILNMSLKPAAVFSDNCVLQRGKNIAVFGSGEEGALVEARLSGKILGRETYQTSEGSAYVRGGRFEITLPPLQAGVEHTLTVSCGAECMTYQNIAVGEVWLAGGQSNMEFELQNCAESEVLNNPDNPMLRFYYTQKKSYFDDEFFRSEEQTAWECFGDPGSGAWSAVGYFFAARLWETLHVPVGIIGCNWGGTSASNWMPRSALAEDAELKTYLDIYNTAVEGKSEEQQIREYEEYVIYQAEFDRKAAVVYQEKPDIEWDELIAIVGECKWPGPQGCHNPFRPGGLYECMLKRVMPYTLKGFLYYQGESDDHLPHLYQKLFTRMIRQWREDWRDDTLPFVFAQLPMHRYKQDPDFKNWCLIREAQNRVYDTVKNTAMTCIIDQGVFNDIHPKMKKTVGERMCAQACRFVYGMAEVPDAEGPLYDFAEIRGQEILLHFHSAEGGFRIAQTGDNPQMSVPGFEIAGEDGRYVSARAVIDGEAIRVSSDQISRPRFARYLWTNYGEVPVFGQNGIPLAPFRTDRRDGFVPAGQNEEIRQGMETGSK